VRIAIDARKLHDYGIGTYIRNLLRQLARIDPQSEYLLLCREADAGVAASLGPNFRAVITAARPYSVAEHVVIPALLRRERADLFHTPHYVLPPLVGCPSVVTIHDCIHLLFPQYLPSRLAYAYARGVMWSAAHRAARILTVSEASKRDIRRFFEVPEQKIEVIYNAIDERFGVAPHEEEVARIRERYQLDEAFMLYVGNIKPHKNLERLIDALHQLRGEGFDHLRLLIIGDEISKYATLRRAVHHFKLHKHVRFLGFVPDRTLAVLYRLAAVFVFPSLYEGFGLPPLEAMASGTPVVTSNVSSLPEVMGDAAVLIDPYDPAAIASGIRSVLANPAHRADLVARGLARARDFSWERSVRRVRDIYASVLGEA
jgi:glycosyltransferase involved in cell wall biosynthesis